MFVFLYIFLINLQINFVKKRNKHTEIETSGW